MNQAAQNTPETSVMVNTASRRKKIFYERAVIILRKTRLEELVARFATRAQAKFYLEHAGQSFAPIEQAHLAYHNVFDATRNALPNGLKYHVIDREQLPQYTFSENDFVITIGLNGLVVNTAKYLSGQPIFAINPDPENIDGILLPFTMKGLEANLIAMARGKLGARDITMAAASLSDGQELIAFNDLFIGANSHVSARYKLSQGDMNENQSSSGIIVSTGAGSTGWLQSIYAGASGIIKALGGTVMPPANHGQLPWDTDHLIYAVREPFPSKLTGTNIVFGIITRDQPLVIESHMATNGVVFSDGMEVDYAAFTAGLTATINLANQRARLVVPDGWTRH